MAGSRDVDQLTTQWRAVSHRLAEFENQGLLADGDEAWRPVLTALIDGYAAAAHPTQNQYTERSAAAT